MTEQLQFNFQMRGPEGEQVWTAGAGTTTIGRQPDNSWRLDHSIISRYHARLDCSGDTCALTDLDSSNGTLVNDKPLPPGAPFTLSAGDVIRIGPFQLVYQPIAIAPGPQPEPEPEPESVPRVKEQPAAASAPPPRQEALRPVVQPPRPGANGNLPPGLSLDDSRYLQYLPDIYHTKFMGRFLAAFEAILGPIEWTVDNFDLFLHPATAPEGFLPWLANWFDLTFDASWRVEQRRTLLTEASTIFARRGTPWALGRVLEIYVGQPVKIDDEAEDLDPFTFVVHLPLRQDEVREDLVQQLIDAHKPAHTTYRLQYGN